jgi:hypothetical protein
MKIYVAWRVCYALGPSGNAADIYGTGQMRFDFRIMRLLSLLGQIALVLVLMQFGMQGLQAAGKIWSGLGPDGVYTYAVVIDPQNPSIVYSGTYGEGVLKSTDGGSALPVLNY